MFMKIRKCHIPSYDDVLEGIYKDCEISNLTCTFEEWFQGNK